MILAYALKCFEERANQPKKIASCQHFSFDDQAVCFTQRRRNSTLERKDENRSKTNSFEDDTIDDIDSDNLDSEDDVIGSRQAKQEYGVYGRYQLRGCSSRFNLGKITKK